MYGVGVLNTAEQLLTSTAASWRYEIHSLRVAWTGEVASMCGRRFPLRDEVKGILSLVSPLK